MEIRSLLIVRLSAIGDVIMASGLIAGLRAQYPTAHIAWLVQPEAKDLLTSNDQLDEVIVWPRQQWRRLWRTRSFLQLIRQVLNFRRLLKSKQFDCVLDVQGLLKSGLLARMTGAKVRIGLGSKEGSAGLMTEVLPKPGHDQRIGSEYRAMLKKICASEKNYLMRIPASAGDQKSARQLLKHDHGDYAVICPFTTRPQKHWLEQYWLDLAQRVRQQLDLDVIMLGGPGDVEAAVNMVSQDESIHSLVGKTSLGQAAAVIQGAQLLIGVDTGLTHLGIASDVPTLAIFGSTRPYLDTGTKTAQVLYQAMDCSPCRRHPTCDGAFTCMRSITPEQVFEKALQVLAQQ